MAAPSLEERVAELEKKVARLLDEKTEKEKATPWWEQWFGAFKNNPDFDAAMERGAEYRRTQPTAADECANDVSA
ncbi:MAG TPA: hypothetical protein VFB21_07835 [Chthonomonadaceae bacterium]|nr:hypothetical protein [Chthonomonadaceae bacterium]